MDGLPADAYQTALKISKAQYGVTADGITRHDEEGDKTYSWSQITGSGEKGDLFYLVTDDHFYFCCDRTQIPQKELAVLQRWAEEYTTRP